MLPSLIFGLLLNPLFAILWLGMGVPFSWAIVGVSVVLVGLLALIYKLVKKQIVWQEILQAYAAGLLLFWVSLLASYRELPGSNNPQAMATAGFPLKGFTYPFPPMGGDQPPLEMWPNFFLNFLIWFVVGAVISHFFPKKLKTLPLIIISVYLLLWGIGYVSTAFD